MITIYTTPSCGKCVMMKEYLKEKNINFEEVDVSKSIEARQEMFSLTNQMGVPVIKIDKKVIIGFNKDEINSALNL